MNSVIQTKHLVIGYNNVAIVRDINLTVHKGEIITILGGSGCGKTTLMRNLIGLETPISGEIYMNNINIAQYTSLDSEQEKLIKQNIGVMFQSGALISSMTLLENVLLPLDIHTTLNPALKQQIALLKLALVGLDKFADYYPASISGGMVKRAAIARAMALDPSVIFLDEPSAGLDPITSRELDELILSLSRDYAITFILVTHELPSIRRIADRAIVLNDGRMVADNKIIELEKNSTDPFIKKFFEN